MFEENDETLVYAMRKKKKKKQTMLTEKFQHTVYWVGILTSS
jgi:hypothetical protein